MTTPDTDTPVPTRMLVHALVREDGTVDAGELYDVGGLLGMSDQQVRLCVKRLVAEGRFTHEGRGRKALLRTVADGDGELAPDAAYIRLAYAQDRGGAPWDGVWHLFGFAVPESSRGARDTLRDTLVRLGAAPLQSGLYVSAHAIGPLVEAEAERLGVAAALTRLTSTDLRRGGLADPAELAAALWPLEEVAGRYERLAGLAREVLDRLAGARPPGRAERLGLSVRLAAAFGEAMEPDPLLPPELLPHPWQGATARALAAECWHALARIGDEEEGVRADGAGTGGATPRLFARYRGLLAE
ncbi:PaaX family transcriptional regulator C-terminal domain-containing protein [Streptomyces sp. NPDC094032]|uniref:PaaX family transcriptional regulator C-terminal domain-containing protein n=1 Tax=Streptomyces sp. NPDC094032 TaxID=3155308 RepID=UPI00332FCB9A